PTIAATCSSPGATRSPVPAKAMSLTPTIRWRSAAMMAGRWKFCFGATRLSMSRQRWRTASSAIFPSGATTIIPIASHRRGERAALPLQRFEAIGEALLREGGGQRRDLDHLQRDAARRAEELDRLGMGEAGKLRRLEEGGDLVGLLDLRLQARGGGGRQAEAQVHGRLQPLLHRLVAAADHRLEGRDHVADH